MQPTKFKTEDPLSSAGSKFANSETLIQVVVQDLPNQMMKQMDWGLGSSIAILAAAGPSLTLDTTDSTKANLKHFFGIVFAD